VTDLTRSFFVAEALFNSSGQLTGVNLHRRGLDLRRELAAAWKLLRGEETTPP
jgi:hypothetical protein